jgi:hypothetical protein
VILSGSLLPQRCEYVAGLRLALGLRWPVSRGDLVRLADGEYGCSVHLCGIKLRSAHCRGHGIGWRHRCAFLWRFFCRHAVDRRQSAGLCGSRSEYSDPLHAVHPRSGLAGSGLFHRQDWRRVLLVSRVQRQRRLLVSLDHHWADGSGKTVSCQPLVEALNVLV